MPKTVLVRHRGRPRTAQRARTVTINGRRSKYSRVPRRGARTQTKLRTMVKTKLNQKIKTSKDGPVSDSLVKYPFGHKIKLGKFKILTAPYFFVTNAQSYLSWTSGLQSHNSLLRMWETTDLAAMYAMYAANIPKSTTGANTTKMYFKSCYAETVITNQTNDVVHMILYDVIARRDLTNSSTAESLYLDPSVAWTQGCIDSGVSGTDACVGSTPFQTPGFTQYYRIIKITDVDIHTGGHHKHKVYCNPKKMVSQEVVSTLDNAGAEGTLGHLTCFTMAVCHGYPDNLTGGTQVTTASGKIDFVQRKQYEFWPIGSERTIVANINNLASGVASESIITDLTGAVTSIVTA